MRCAIDWKKRLPILGWLRNYSVHKLQSDFIAGVTVGLMVIPQALAYANIAELPPQYGLYSSFMGSFMYCLFGSSKDITQGPTAILSLLVATYSTGSPHIAIALSFYIGIIWLIMGICSLGFIIRIMPLPVISSFSTAATITIACGQLKYILGLSGIPRDFIPCLIKLFSKIGQTNLWDVLLGAICIFLLELLRYIKPNLDQQAELNCELTTVQKGARKFLWIVCTARNAVIVFASSLVALALFKENETPFTLTGHIKEGLPSFQFPTLNDRKNNETAVDLISNVGAGFIVMPMIGFVENIVSAQAFANVNHYQVDGTQELLSLGVVNLANSFVSGYPVTGSFSRTAVNAMSGVATPLGGIFTGAVVLLALSVFTPFFKYVPKASLASVIIMALLRIIDVRIVSQIWKTNKIDLLPYFATFFICFYQLDIGILCGIVMAILVFMYRRIVPEVEIRKEANGLCRFKVYDSLTYAGAENFTSKVRKALFANDRPPAVVFDFSELFECDFTLSKALVQLHKECSDRGVRVAFDYVQSNVKEILLNAGLAAESFTTELPCESYGIANN